MKHFAYLIIGLLLLSTPLASTTNATGSEGNSYVETLATGVLESGMAAAQGFSDEAAEAGNGQQFFVIIGSFKLIENAEKYVNQARREGFVAEMLTSEDGFFRISVLSTDKISQARDEVKRIRSSMPKHCNTWLLVS